MFLDEKLLQSISGIKFTHWADKSKAEEKIIECLVQSIIEAGKDIPNNENFLHHSKAMLKRHCYAWDSVMNKLTKNGISLFEGYTSFNYILNNYCRNKLPSYIINIII